MLHTCIFVCFTHCSGAQLTPEVIGMFLIPVKALPVFVSETWMRFLVLTFSLRAQFLTGFCLLGSAVYFCSVLQ